MKENITNLQDGEPRGGILSHVLYENPHTKLRMDSRAPATPQIQIQSQQQPFCQ